MAHAYVYQEKSAEISTLAVCTVNPTTYTYIEMYSTPSGTSYLICEDNQVRSKPKL